MAEVTVDPYRQRIPKRWSNQDGTPTREAEDWLKYDNRFKENLWLRTGGPEDSVDASLEEIEDNQQALANHDAIDGKLRSRINGLEEILSIQAQENAQLKSEIGKLRSQLNKLILNVLDINQSSTEAEIGKIRADIRSNKLEISNINQLIS